MKKKILALLAMSACLVLSAHAATVDSQLPEMGAQRGCNCPQPPQGPPGPPGAICEICLSAALGLEIDLEAILAGEDPLIFAQTAVSIDCLSINANGEIIIDSELGAGDYLIRIDLNFLVDEIVTADPLVDVTGSFDLDLENINGLLNLLSEIPFPQLVSTVAGSVTVSACAAFSIDPGDIVGTTNLFISLNDFDVPNLNFNGTVPYIVTLVKIN